MAIPPQVAVQSLSQLGSFLTGDYYDQSEVNQLQVDQQLLFPAGASGGTATATNPWRGSSAQAAGVPASTVNGAWRMRTPTAAEVNALTYPANSLVMESLVGGAWVSKQVWV